MKKVYPSYAQDPGHHVIDCLTHLHLPVAGEWMKKYGTARASPTSQTHWYRQAGKRVTAERDALRKLIEDLKLGLSALPDGRRRLAGRICADTPGLGSPVPRRGKHAAIW